MEENIKLYRKRYIPNEIMFLKDDQILHIDNEVLVTKWNVLKPRKDFQKGISCYFLKKGYKISKFLNENDELVYYYCDIIDVSYQAETQTYIFTDLLADVIVEKDGMIKVVDLGEIADALEQSVITTKIAQKALKRLDGLLQSLYENGCVKMVEKYFGGGEAEYK